MTSAPPRVTELLRRLRSIGEREAERSSATCRRSCGASAATTSTSAALEQERPYTPDGSVNYAHLLVGG